MSTVFDPQFVPEFRRGLFLCWAILVVVSLIYPRRARAQPMLQPMSGAELTIIHSDAHSIELMLVVDRFHTGTRQVDGQSFHSVHIDGLVQSEQPGAPQLPSHSVILGVPTLDELAIDVLDAESEALDGYRLAPSTGLTATVPTVHPFEMETSSLPKTVASDEGRYSSDHYYPPNLVQLSEPGYVRDQAVVQVHFFPVQYNPVSGKLLFHRRIRVRLSWQAPLVAAGQDKRMPSAAFENLLDAALFNYDSLGRAEPIVLDASTASASLLTAVEGDVSHLKMGITVPGFYRLTRNDLDSAGLPVERIDPRRLSVHNRGREVAVHVHGEEDGILDEGDVLSFYAQGIDITEPEAIYTNENIYWLSVGEKHGLRMSERDGTPVDGVDIPMHFPTHQHFEQDTVYWRAMPDGFNADHWFWGKLLSPDTENVAVSRPYTVTLNAPAANAGVATVRVSLKGYTTGAHQTRILVNGVLVDEPRWAGQIDFEHVFEVDHNLLRDGANTIVVEAIDSGETPDQVLVNWFAIDYHQRYAAANNQLHFLSSTTGPRQFVVRNLSKPTVDLYDIGNPIRPVRIINTDVSKGEPIADARAKSDSGFVARFHDDVQPENAYWILTSDQYRSPDWTKVDRPSTWKSTDNGADYLLITHRDFYTSTLRLAEHRRQQGLRVAVVTVDDLYDEFNHGIYHPRAICDFIAYAYDAWQGAAPTYVLLAGDAYQDYRDALGLGVRNYVPSLLLETELFGEVSSDHGFVTVNGDDILPDLFVGRLPGRSVEEIDAMIDKIIAYETDPPSAAWRDHVLLVADDDESGFSAISSQLASRLPVNYTVKRIDVADYPPGDPTADILNSIHQGVALVHYSGHGEYFRWGKWQDSIILDLEDVTALTNRNRLPLVTMANCLNGFFTGPTASVAEQFLGHPQGGAMAVWAPSGMSFPSSHRVLMDALYAALFRDDQVGLGAATTAAKIAAYAQGSVLSETMETYQLFGDPATRLRLPANPPYLKSATPSPGAVDMPIDSPLLVRFNKRMDPTTVSVRAGGMPLKMTWNLDSTVATITHDGDFEHGKTVMMAVAGSDVHGVPLAEGPIPTNWSFTVSPDRTPPTAKISVEDGPSRDRTGTATITITFSEPVRRQSMVVEVAPLVTSTPDGTSKSEIEAEVVWHDGGRVAELTYPSWATERMEHVRLVAVTDLAGNRLERPIEKRVGTSQEAIFLPTIIR